MPEPSPSPTPDLFLEAATALIAEQPVDHGVLLLGVPGLPVLALLDRLGGPGHVAASLIGADGEAERLLTEARTAGYDDVHFGIGSDHAVRVRNLRVADDGDLTPGTRRLVFVLRWEDQLNSLFERGYIRLGTDDVAAAVARQAHDHAPNEPLRALWGALANRRPPLPDLLAYVSALTPVTAGSATPADVPGDPRSELPRLGLLRDPALLDGGPDEKAVAERVQANADLAERLQRADLDDVEKAQRRFEEATAPRTTVAPDEAEGIRRAYAAFLRIERGELAFDALTFEEAKGLLGERPLRSAPPPALEPPPEPDVPPEPAPEPPPPRSSRPPSYPDLDTAALVVLAEEPPSADGTIPADLEEAARKLREALEQGGAHPEKLVTDRFEVPEPAAPDALAIVRAFCDEDRLGGMLRTDEPLETALADLAAQTTRPDRLRPFDAPALAQLQEFFHIARTLIGESFEGEALLNAYLDARARLLPHAEMLAAAPLTALVTSGEAREAVVRAVEAFGRLLAHLDEQYGALEQHSGALHVVGGVLGLDIVVVEASDDRAALVLPVSPLALWKYTELARLLQEGHAADVRDLFAEVALPEPLRALVLPGPGSSRLAFVGRVGTLPIYRANRVTAADVAEATIVRAAKKLAALYPTVRDGLRVHVHHPGGLEPVARALRKLEGDGFRRYELSVSLPRAGPTPTTRTLDTLHEEGILEVQASSVPSSAELRQLLERRPVHLLVVSGERQTTAEAIQREHTSLHPLSTPHRLRVDPFTGVASFVPRSVRSAAGTTPHPFEAYHLLAGRLLGQPERESAGTERRDAATALRPLLDYTLFAVVAGAVDAGDDMLRLARASGPAGDTVLTAHRTRVIEGLRGTLQKLHLQPTAPGLLDLLRGLESVGGEGVLHTISDKLDHRAPPGFSHSGLRGVLGNAVALAWHRANAHEGRSLVLSLDTPAAARWMGRFGEEKKRCDLLGIRETPDGALVVDLIEVKAYEVGNPAEPREQLETTARLVWPMLHQGGNLITDRRRELLREQILEEGGLGGTSGAEAASRAEWAALIDRVLDGEANAELRMTLMEVRFDRHDTPTAEEIPGRADGDAVAALPLHRVRLGEGQVQPFLAGLSIRFEEPEPPTDTDSSEPEPPGPPPDEPPAPDDQPPVGTAVPPSSEEGSEVDSVPPEDEAVETQARALHRALQEIGFPPAEPVDPALADVGPSVVRFKVRLRSGHRLNQVQGRTADLMREMALMQEPIVDNLPGTQFVAVDIPRKHAQSVLLPPTPAEEFGRGGLRAPVGMTPAGEVVWLEVPPDGPHFLVAGASGSGKTMFLYTLVLGLATRNTPEQLRLLLIDPKRTDFHFFNALPHLLDGRVITDSEEAVSALRRVLDEEIEHRRSQILSAGHRDLRGYLASQAGPPLPLLVIVIDEFADLMDVLPKRERAVFGLALKRLAQMARSVGVHLVIATQRPSVDVITGSIKANLDDRIAFRLASQVDSRTVLDRGGAENLLGRGDMLLSRKGTVTRLQGFYVAESRLRALVEEIALRFSPA